MSTRRRISLVLACVLSASALHAQELPPRALARLGDHRFHHGFSIELVALSPDGSKAASSARKPSDFKHVTDEDRDSFDRTIVLWNAATGERLRELHAPETPVRSLVFSPDGKQLLVVSGPAENSKHIVLFDVGSDKIVDRLGVFKEYAESPRFSADGKKLLIGQGWDAVMSLDLATGKPERTWKAPAPKSEWVKEKETVYHGVPSPDGKFIAWQVWEPPDYGKLPLGDIPPPVVPRPTVLVVVDAALDKVLYRKDFGSQELDAFVFSHDGRWYMNRGDKKVAAFETATGKELFSLAEPSPRRIAVSPNGRWAVFSGVGRCRLWDLETRKMVHELSGDIGYYHDGNQLFSADGKNLVLWNYSTLRMFDTASGKERTSVGHRDRNIAVRFAQDGSKLFSTCVELRCTWDVSPGRKPTLLTQARRQAWEIGDEVDYRFFVDHTNLEVTEVRIRDTRTGQVVHKLEKDAWWGTFARFSPDASRLAIRKYLMETGTDKEGRYWIRHSAEPEKMYLYDTKTGKKTGEIKLKNGGYWVVPGFSPDGKTIAWADVANNVHLHDSITGKLLRTMRSTLPLPKKEGRHAELLFSPDGKQVIVTVYNHELFGDPKDVEKWTTLPTRVFDVASGKEIRRFYGNPEKTRGAPPFSCVACSPDNRLFAAAEKESALIRLIEIDSGTVRAEFRGHRDGVHSLAFSPDGKTLASGGDDNVIYLWDVIGLGTELAGKNTATDADLARWWADLANSTKAEAALVSLIREGEPSVKALSARLRPIEPMSDKRLADLFADLEADGFAARQAATEELSRLGDRVEDRLRAELKKQPSVEAQRRIEELLGKLDVGKLPSATLQTLRAIEALERIGSSTSLACLERLATGAPEAWETRAARAAVGRLGKRSKMK